MKPLPPPVTLVRGRTWQAAGPFSTWTLWPPNHPWLVSYLPLLASSKRKSKKGIKTLILSGLFPGHLCEISEPLLTDFILEDSVIPEKAGCCGFLIHKTGLGAHVSQRHYGAGVPESSPKSRIKGHISFLLCLDGPREGVKRKHVTHCGVLGSTRSFGILNMGMLART